MRKSLACMLLVLLLLPLGVSCKRDAKVIPPKQMSDLYFDLFLADQWLRDNQSYREQADTTLFFDPIFANHGVSFEDYLNSVEYYSADPEAFAAIVQDASDRLEKVSKDLFDLLAKRTEVANINARNRVRYVETDFSTDSIRWEILKKYWKAVPDTLGPAPADSLDAPDSTAVKYRPSVVTFENKVQQ